MSAEPDVPEILIRFRDRLGNNYALVFSEERGPMLAAEADVNNPAEWREWSGWAPGIIGLTRT